MPLVTLYDTTTKSDIATAVTVDEAVLALYAFADALKAPLPTGRTVGDHVLYEFNSTTLILSPVNLEF